MGVCKGVCVCKYDAPKGKRMYLHGGKRCTNCETFVDWEGIHCPCCGTKLRVKIRSRAARIELYKRI